MSQATANLGTNWHLRSAAITHARLAAQRATDADALLAKGDNWDAEANASVAVAHAAAAEALLRLSRSEDQPGG